MGFNSAFKGLSDMRMKTTKLLAEENTSSAKTFIPVPVKISAEKRVGDFSVQIAAQNEDSKDHTG